MSAGKIAAAADRPHLPPPHSKLTIEPSGQAALRTTEAANQGGQAARSSPAQKPKPIRSGHPGKIPFPSHISRSRSCHNEPAVSGQWLAEAVWKSMLHFESLQRYYAFVGKRLAWRRRLFSVLILTASSSAAGALLFGLPPEIALFPALAVVLLTIWSELADYSAKSSLCLDLAADLGHLSTEMRALWFGMDELDAEAAESAWRELEARVSEATRRVPADLLGHSGLQDRAEDETYAYWTAAQHATGAEA